MWGQTFLRNGEPGYRSIGDKWGQTFPENRRLKVQRGSGLDIGQFRKRIAKSVESNAS